MADTIIEGDFPFEEIRDDVVGGNGDYFASWQAAKDAGFDDDQIWSITGGDDNSYTYGPPHHYVNHIGHIATKERHDNATYYVETWEMDEDDEDYDDDGNLRAGCGHND
jgi:hypothetical protein